MRHRIVPLSIFRFHRNRRYNLRVSSFHILYASTSGHTEYVVGVITDTLKAGGVDVSSCRVELATVADFSKGDVLLLASGTWNTGGPEGQLNPHMHAFLTDRAKDAALHGKNVALIALGDDRYRYTANASVHMEEYVKNHGGTLLTQTLKIINEPYGQEKKIKEWATQLVNSLTR